MTRTLFLLFLLTACTTARGFVIDGTKWPGGETEFYVLLPGISATGIGYNAAFIEALTEWNDRTDFNFVIRNEFRNPCIDDGLNGVDFTADVCGNNFGANTLAVTIRSFSSQILGPARIDEADIVFNEEVDYNVFDGNLVQFGINGLDFRRIALHELGHAIGMEHEPSFGVDAIMAPNIGNIFRLQQDDIDGANKLYGGLSSCTINTLAFGESSNSLMSGDCTVDDLSAGGGDTSFIDIYQFELTSTTTVDFEMTSPTLDSVLLLADTSLEVFQFDNQSSNNCDSSLSATLSAGTYFLLANTFDVAVKTECGIVGSYSLSSSFSSPELLPLGPSISFQGTPNFASFTGGITATAGASFGNQFKPDDSLTIEARIDVDATHQGQPGFIVVAAALEDQILLLNSEGQFLPANKDPANLIHASEKVLGSVEEITIATGLVPADFDIESISVEFVVGYGLDSAPENVYFHQIPINLTVSP